MPGDNEILIETAFRTFRVQVHRFPVPLTNAQRDDAQRLALELRFGLGSDPELQVAAQRISHGLLGTGPVRLRRPHATLETQRFFQRLRGFLEDQLDAGRFVVLPEPAVANVPERRTALIEEYMSLDDTSLDDDSSAGEDAA